MKLDQLQRLDAVAREHERYSTPVDLPAELLQDQLLQVWLVIDYEDRGRHAASSSLASISCRNRAKSIGLVRRPSAPLSIAFFRVSASP